MRNQTLFWDFLRYQKIPDTLDIRILSFFVQFSFFLIILKVCILFYSF